MALWNGDKPVLPNVFEVMSSNGKATIEAFGERTFTKSQNVLVLASLQLKVSKNNMWGWYCSRKGSACERPLNTLTFALTLAGVHLIYLYRAASQSVMDSSAEGFEGRGRRGYKSRESSTKQEHRQEYMNTLEDTCIHTDTHTHTYNL
jgi:hypothetical protein